MIYSPRIAFVALADFTELTLKAKGLFSQMLSLSEDCDYTLAELSHINWEKIDAIREAVKELERAGYILRSRERDEKGRLWGANYVIYEQPQPPNLDLPTLENPMHLNKKILKTDLPKTDLSNTHSIPILSPNPSPLEQGAAEPPERNRKEASTESTVEIYREIIKDNIEYEHLAADKTIDPDRLDEIVEIMLETVCTARKTLR